MRTRLIVSFSVPVVAVMLVVLCLVHWILFSRSASQVLALAGSNYEQAHELVTSYIDMMLYTSNSIYYNGDLQRILGNPSYIQEKSMDERYREFLTLDDVFSMAENMDVIYRAGIYLPGEIPYTNNQVHILPLDTLSFSNETGGYDQEGKSFYFLPNQKVYTPGSLNPVETVTLLRPVRTTDGSSRDICIAQVCVEVERFAQAVHRAKITEGSFVYLADEKGREVTSTDSALFQQLEQDGSLPLLGNEETWTRKSVREKEYFVLQRFLPEVRWTLTAMIPVGDVNVQTLYITEVLIVLAVLVLLSVILVAILLSSSYTRRLKNLNFLIQRVRSGELQVNSGSEKDQDEISELFNSFQQMTVELQNLMRAQYRSGKAVKTAELRALQAQINPHFLYNTLDLINWDAFEHDAPEISEIAQNLAKFYRLSLNKGRPVLTVGEELQHVQAYVSIENRHFDGAILLHTDIPEEVESLVCLNIILQPFVENSIIHGFAENPARGVCNIWIKVWREGEDLVFQVQDDGPGMTAEQMEAIFQKNTVRQTSGYGVRNIQLRIQLCFGEVYGVTYQSIPGKGTTALIRIPALTPEEAENRLENL